MICSGKEFDWGETGMRRLRWSTIVFGLVYVVFVVGVFLALGGAAYAQENPAEAQYISQTEDADVTGPQGPSGPSGAGVDTDVAGAGQDLPSTGLSLLATALIGGALLALGIALRRRERHRDG
jgi:LPXTG-motif cell wall-anchored protein